MEQVIPIGPEHNILRRIPKTMVNLGLPQPILLAAFRPSPEDQDGLSCFWTEKTTPAEISQGGRKPGEYFVVNLSVLDLNNLGLSVVAADLPDGPPGHVVIPEINWSIYHADKSRLRPILSRMAELASQAIVLHPQK